MDTYGIHGNLLEVTVVGCNKLKDTEWISRQDPYVCIDYGSNRSRTRTCKDGGQNPTFQEKFVYTLIEGLRELNVNVWNSNTLKYDDFIGSGKVQLEKALSQGFDDRTWPLQSSTGRHAGEVLLVIRYSNANKPAGSHVPAASSHAAPQAFYSASPPHPSTSYPSPATAATYPPVGGYPAPSPYTSYPPHLGKSEKNYHTLGYDGEFLEHSFEWNDSSYRPKKRIIILWDMENCEIPKGVPPEDVSTNILAFLGQQTEIKWDVIDIAAYADFSKFSERVRNGCTLTGVKLIDIPNVKEGAADRALIVALFEYAIFCPPPSSIMLVTGDVDFATALHVLRRRGHDIYLVIPSGVRVSTALTNASNYVWDWSDVVRGKVLPTSSFEVKENQMHFEEKLLGSATDDGMLVQPGDLTVLKNEIVKLVKNSGGCLRLVCLASEYQKCFKKLLRASDYQALKLVDLLEKMNDVLYIEGRGGEKVVLLN